MTDTALPAATAWSAPVANAAVNATVHIPGSKSMMSRALVLAAASDGASSLAAPLRARDSALMVAGLQALGVSASIDDDSLWTIQPGAVTQTATVDCGLAGTVMRFLPPLAAADARQVDFHGDPHAQARPIGPLLRGLQQLGVEVHHSGGYRLPFSITSTGRTHTRTVTLDSSASSQFVSGLLLAAPRYEHGLTVKHDGPPIPSAPHVAMTVEMLRQSGATVDDSTNDVWEIEPATLPGRDWQIEPDLSSAAPFLAAAIVTGGSTTIPRWPHTTSQPGDMLRDLLTQLGARVTRTSEGLQVSGTGAIHGIDVDLAEAGELTPVVAALCALADSPSTLRGIAHLRGHETDRLRALRLELNKLGGEVEEIEDGLRIKPRRLHGTVFDTYADHRMAHAAAVIGLAVPGVELSDVACTSKTLPQFPQMWAELLGMPL